MKFIKGIKANYTIREVNDIGDYAVTISNHKTISNGTTYLVSNFDYGSLIERIENDKKMIDR